MKFNCGLSPCEKARIHREFVTAEAARLREWHDWFAWFPVRVGEHDCRWMEIVQRKYPDAENHYGSLRKYGRDDWGSCPEYQSKDSDSTTEVK